MANPQQISPARKNIIQAKISPDFAY